MDAALEREGGGGGLWGSGEELERTRRHLLPPLDRSAGEKGIWPSLLYMRKVCSLDYPIDLSCGTDYRDRVDAALEQEGVGRSGEELERTRRHLLPPLEGRGLSASEKGHCQNLALAIFPCLEQIPLLGTSACLLEVGEW